MPHSKHSVFPLERPVDENNHWFKIQGQ